jgi:hypothetical protein
MLRKVPLSRRESQNRLRDTTIVGDGETSPDATENVVPGVRLRDRGSLRLLPTTTARMFGREGELYFEGGRTES